MQIGHVIILIVSIATGGILSAWLYTWLKSYFGYRDVVSLIVTLFIAHSLMIDLEAIALSASVLSGYQVVIQDYLDFGLMTERGAKIVILTIIHFLVIRAPNGNSRKSKSTDTPPNS